MRQLQIELNADNGMTMPVDGIFGGQTMKAVEIFQQNHHLSPVDGIVGVQTKAALDNPGPGPAAASGPAPGQSQATPAPSPLRCATAQDSMNVMAPELPWVQEGSVNLNVYWCWDGTKILDPAAPVTWTSTTLDGALLMWNTNPPVTVNKDPKNSGGFWTLETVITGTVAACVTKYGCGPAKPFKLDLYVFGDGVKYIANRSEI